MKLCIHLCKGAGIPHASLSALVGYPILEWFPGFSKAYGSTATQFLQDAHSHHHRAVRAPTLHATEL